MAPRTRIMLAAVVAAGTVGIACDGDGQARSSTSVASAPTTTVARLDDGVLRIGVLLPSTGDGADVGAPLLAAVDLALNRINDAGGVLGRPVERVVADEGDSPSEALQAVRELLDGEVDAVVGPASSRSALNVLEVLVSAGVTTCSPTASALALDAFPDAGLFFRTIPSDAMQAKAIADKIEQTGQPTVAIAYLDDPYGRPLASVLQGDVQERNVAVLASVGYTPSEEQDTLTDVATRLLADRPAVVAVIGDADTGLALIGAAASVPGGQDAVFVVNDAMRRPLEADVLDELSPATLTNITGIAPAAAASNADFRALLGASDGPYALNAYDCVNLLALAAAAGGSDSPRGIAQAMAPVSSGGSACTDFADCAALIREGRNIDYNGPDGQVELNGDGETSRARFDVFEFDARTGLDTTVASLTLSG